MISRDNSNIGIQKFIVGTLATNCYVVFDPQTLDGVIIDPGDFHPGIKSFIEESNLSISCIINTHGHADHIFGNAQFDYPVMIHELDKDCLFDSLKNLSFMTGNIIEKVSDVKIVKDGDSMVLGNIHLNIIHTPGHTPGSISIKADTVLFSGDTLFFEGIGRTDLPEGDFSEIINSIRTRLMTLPDNVIVYPGHGPETTIGHERLSNPRVS